MHKAQVAEVEEVLTEEVAVEQGVIETLITLKLQEEIHQAKQHYLFQQARYLQ